MYISWIKALMWLIVRQYRWCWQMETLTSYPYRNYATCLSKGYLPVIASGGINQEQTGFTWKKAVNTAVMRVVDRCNWCTCLCLCLLIVFWRRLAARWAVESADGFCWQDWWTTACQSGCRRTADTAAAGQSQLMRQWWWFSEKRNK